MTLILYELAAADENVRFSPHCWKIRMALAHKGLEAERRPWHFIEKDAIAFSQQERVPVLVHNDETISDSWAIATHLDKAAPDAPPLFCDHAPRSLALFVNNWADSILLPALARLIMTDIYSSIAPCDKNYFRKTREKKFGQTLEEISLNRNIEVSAFQELLSPLRAALASQPFLSADRPSYADYCVFGYFMWARCVSNFNLLEPDDPLNTWRDSLLDAYGGLARNAPRAKSAEMKTQ